MAALSIFGTRAEQQPAVGMGGDAAAGSVMGTVRAYSIMVLAVFGVVVNLACIGILLRRRRNAIFHNLLKVWRRQRKRGRESASLNPILARVHFAVL